MRKDAVAALALVAATFGWLSDAPGNQPPVTAMDAANLVGRWEGAIDTGGATNVMVLEVKKDLSATIVEAIWPDLGPYKFVCKAVVFNGAKFRSSCVGVDYKANFELE